MHRQGKLHELPPQLEFKKYGSAPKGKTKMT